MSNYINGFVSCLCIIVLVVVVMGFQYGGTQHFNDIVANSITLVDKNGLGGVLTLVDKDGGKLLEIEGNKIHIFNQYNDKVIGVSSNEYGRGSIKLNEGSFIEAYNDNSDRVAFIGSHDNSGMMSTYNSRNKRTSFIGSDDNGNGQITIYDKEAQESLILNKVITALNSKGKVVSKYGTNKNGDGYVMLYDSFGNRGWYKTGKSS